ncbi:MAG: SPFH domain-containing protein [Lachnospiraceae bacterium]|nr:SPFH domain-containing protein [Ruminococcus sp.]MCM1276174.1 SPFH domain-containing protein [Lachnospiraceae bacterium]
MEKNAEKTYTYEEKELHPASGWAVLFVTLFVMLGALALIIWGASESTDEAPAAALVVGIILLAVGWFPLTGLKVMRPNEALVLTLFGKYIGTLKKEGYFFVNPFSTPVGARTGGSGKLSLKTMTHNNEKQKINDLSGNPIEVGIVVTWRVVNTAKAVFNVQNYDAFLSIQADTTLRDVARCYPYDSTDSDEKTLRGSSVEVSERLKELLQERVELAGLEIIEARIAHLAYAQEIAAAMLQRQQATAIIEARQKIVDGAVGMVEMALKKLSESEICELDEERKAQMVSNLLVVLCGNKDAQPIVNSGSIY